MTCITPADVDVGRMERVDTVPLGELLIPATVSLVPM